MENVLCVLSSLFPTPSFQSNFTACTQLQQDIHLRVRRCAAECSYSVCRGRLYSNSLRPVIWRGARTLRVCAEKRRKEGNSLSPPQSQYIWPRKSSWRKQVPSMVYGWEDDVFYWTRAKPDWDNLSQRAMQVIFKSTVLTWPFLTLTLPQSPGKGQSMRYCHNTIQQQLLIKPR